MMLNTIINRCNSTKLTSFILSTNISKQCDKFTTGRRQSSSNSSAYAGDGKTTVRVLNNEDESVNLINTYSHKGFRLSNNLFVTGSILLFPTNLFSWNVKRGADINLDSLLLFDLIVPKVKIVIIGYGQQGEPYDSSLPMKLKKKGISCEMLPTPHAVTTYNYLVLDAVHVAGAFLPVKDQVKMDSRDHGAVKGYDFLKGKEILPAYTRADANTLDKLIARKKANIKYEETREKIK